MKYGGWPGHERDSSRAPSSSGRASWGSAARPSCSARAAGWSSWTGCRRARRPRSATPAHSPGAPASRSRCPACLPQVPGWLLRRDGPLTIRWRYLPRLAPWLWRFVRAGNLERLETSSDRHGRPPRPRPRPVSHAREGRGHRGSGPLHRLSPRLFRDPDRTGPRKSPGAW